MEYLPGTPNLPGNNISNGGKAYAILSSELCKHPALACVRCADFSHLLRGKAGEVVTSAMSHTTFLYGIMGILFCRSEKEVVRADTSARITVMAGKHPFRNGAIGKLVGDAVNELTPTFIVYISHHSISALRSSASPNPAAIRVRAVNMTPETGFEGRMSRHLYNLLCRLAGVWLELLSSAPTSLHYTTSALSLSSFMEVYYGS